MSFPAQAQETISICDRTQQVQDEILRLTATDDDECASVSVSEMAAIRFFFLSGKGIEHLQPGDFDGLTALSVLNLAANNLTDLPAGIFSGLTKLTSLSLEENSLMVVPPGIFSGLSLLHLMSLQGNPGSTFRFTTRFEPKTLDKDFTTASVRLVLREGAPGLITVPLSATGTTTLSSNSLRFSRGSVQSNAVTVTRTGGNPSFRLSQGEPRLSDSRTNYVGFEIVPGPPLTIGIPVRVKVFLEGALE